MVEKIGKSVLAGKPKRRIEVSLRRGRKETKKKLVKVGEEQKKGIEINVGPFKYTKEKKETFEASN